MHGVFTSLASSTTGPRRSASSTPVVPNRVVGLAADPIGQNAAMMWEKEVVVDSHWFQDMGSQYMRLDSADHPHMAYGWNHLYYVWYDGSTWRNDTVDEADRVGGGASLALDSHDTAHISYCDQARGALKYATRIGPVWVIQWVTHDGGCTRTSLQLDQTSSPHIAYASDSGIQYVHWTGRTWESQSIASGRSPYLVLDHADRPHIAHITSYATYVSWYDGASWHSERVPDQQHHAETWAVALALDDAGNEHVVSSNYYHRVGGSDWSAFSYARRTDGGWEIPWGRAGNGPIALTLDKAGYPHIGYGGSAYSRWNGSAWEDLAVPAGGGGALAIALDDHDTTHLAYLNGAELRHATWTGGTWSVEAADRRWDVGLDPSLALDSSGSVHIGFRDGDGALHYARGAQDHWAVETADAAAQATTLSLALERSGVPHLGYVTDEWAFRHAWRTSADWQTEAIGAAEFSSGRFSLALDNHGNPRIAFTDWFMVKYAFRTAQGWSTEVVSNFGERDVVSLALDASDTPVIAFRSGQDWETGKNYIMLARRTESGWSISRVDRAGWSSPLSLALDPAGVAYIGYVGEGDTLRLAKQSESGWQIQIVDNGVNGYDTDVSLALDRAGFPHLTYGKRDWTSSGPLQHARRTGDSWDITTVETDAGRYSSLAVDELGRPHIAYYDEVYHRLKYAVGKPQQEVTATPTPTATTSPTPTATPTATITITPTPHRRYLPLVLIR